MALISQELKILPPIDCTEKVTHETLIKQVRPFGHIHNALQWNHGLALTITAVILQNYNVFPLHLDTSDQTRQHHWKPPATVRPVHLADLSCWLFQHSILLESSLWLSLFNSNSICIKQSDQCQIFLPHIRQYSNSTVINVPIL